MKLARAIIFLLAVVLIFGLVGGCSGQTASPSEVDTDAAAPVALDFTTVPPLGSNADLQGRVYSIATPANYRLAVYIHVPGYGWVIKPTAAQPATVLKPDCTFHCDITTGGNDAQADRIAAFLVPATYTIPAVNGVSALPTALYANAITNTMWQRSPQATWRVLQFSGYEWAVKSSPGLMGPGPDYFSSSGLSVWVSKDGRLHLKARRVGNRWLCAEVLCGSHLGYGTYTWTLASDVSAFDKNVVLGLFTWSDQAAYAHRELDFEVGRFGNAATPNSSYSVQPYDLAGHHHPFTMPAGPSAHRFVWSASKVQFKSVRGMKIGVTDPASIVQIWNYTLPGVPVPGDEVVHMNLWLFNDPTTPSQTGEPPADGKPVEVVIDHFTFAK